MVQQPRALACAAPPTVVPGSFARLEGTPRLVIAFETTSPQIIICLIGWLMKCRRSLPSAPKHNIILHP